MESVVACLMESFMPHLFASSNIFANTGALGSVVSK